MNVDYILVINQKGVDWLVSQSTNQSISYLRGLRIPPHAVNEENKGYILVISQGGSVSYLRGLRIPPHAVNEVNNCQPSKSSQPPTEAVMTATREDISIVLARMPLVDDHTPARAQATHDHQLPK